MPGPSHSPRQSRVQRRRFVCIATAAAVAIVVLSVALALIVSPNLFIRLGLTELETATGIQVRYRTGRLGLSGIVLRDVDLRIRARTPPLDAQRALRMQRVLVRPSLLGLLTGHRGLPCSVFADLYDGSATLTLNQQRNLLMAALDWSAIDARHLPLGQDKPDITGLSDGRISVSAHEIDGRTALEGSWSIGGTEITLNGLKSGHLLLPPITLSTLYTTGAWTGRRATVTELDVEGAFGRMFLSGKLVLRTPLDRTGLNMHMTLAASPDIPQELGFLLRMMLPQGSETSGQQSYHVAGTLAMPMLTAVADQR